MKSPKETEFIDNIKNKYCLNEWKEDIFGIGDDCAYIKRNNIVVTSDILTENVHFDLSFISPYVLGQKSALVNISDVVSMGAEPKYAFVSLGYNNHSFDFLDKLYRGMSYEFKKAGALILGGDTVRSENLVINITLVGESDSPIFRQGAKPGDSIIVSNYCGLSHAGFDLLSKYKSDYPREYQSLAEAHLCPKVSVDLGLKLKESCLINSMMDISDGIAKDLKTLCRASGVGASLELNDFLISPELEKFCRKENKDVYTYMLSNFEDYSLLMTCKRGSEMEVLEIISFCGFHPSIIGKITDEKTIKVTLRGEDYPMPLTWEHF
ncbi:MAG: thiamine-phosphate kinase [Abditibacteriota bacterium]|nr:thiamine-phosphate kinase [Abditibacteriota bacterium]